MKRIFYFNITYGCNSNCVFCYSHNTRHDAKTYNEIAAVDFFAYLEMQRITADDRVIINGGEPFLHTEIDTILEGLSNYGCEVLIYTNGRLLTEHDLSGLSEKYRFVIPIHGYESVHDFITGIPGSYRDTLNGLNYLVDHTKCMVDIKIIINNKMIHEDYKGKRLICSLPKLRFNNAVHITKMADTIVSIRNGCHSVENEDAADYTALLLNYYKKRKCRIKIFDTCIKGIEFDGHYEKYKKSITVYFKDKSHYRVMNLSRRIQSCMNNCKYLDKCNSAVDEYKVLEYYEGKIFENLE